MSHRPDTNQSVSYYPTMLNLHRRPVVVIGGGDVAEQKIAGLLAAGGDLTVVSPDLTPALAELVKANRISWKASKYRGWRPAGSLPRLRRYRHVNQTVWQETEPTVRGPSLAFHSVL